MNTTASQSVDLSPANVQISCADPSPLTGEISRCAQQRMQQSRGEPFFLANWQRTMFIHYEVDRELLQRVVPFELDLYQGKAYVSLVAFQLENLRPRLGGRIGATLFKPIANHEFLNIRAYVRHRGEPGIYFLEEYLPNRIATALGPVLYGLPYRLGRLHYAHEFETGSLRGEIRKGADACRYTAILRAPAEFRPCRAATLDEFLLERYVAYTWFHGLKRRFRIWHPPWPQVPVDVTMQETSLLAKWDWFRQGAKLIGGHFSPGVREVWMGCPALVPLP